MAIMSEGEPIDPFNLPEVEALLSYIPEENAAGEKTRMLMATDPFFARSLNFAMRARMIPPGERGSTE